MGLKSEFRTRRKLHNDIIISSKNLDKKINYTRYIFIGFSLLIIGTLHYIIDRYIF